MKLYKLTNARCQTHGETQWGENVTHTAPGTGELCRSGWIHAYTNPLLAVLLNPIHADIPDPILWECRGKIGKTDHGLKVGCTSLTTIRRIRLPEVSRNQHIRFGILCAMRVCKDASFVSWAHSWLDGSDRLETAARAAAEAAAARAAAWAAEAAAAQNTRLPLAALARQGVREEKT